MANGYVVGSILDQGGALTPSYPSTTARVELRLQPANTLKRTLYPTKAAGDNQWHYSTSIAPGKYRVNAFDTTPGHTYPYLDVRVVDVKDSQACTADFSRRDSAQSGTVDDPNQPVLDAVEAARRKIESDFASALGFKRLGLPSVEVIIED